MAGRLSLNARSLEMAQEVRKLLASLERSQRYWEELQARHYARRTVNAYEQWLRRFLRFHGMRHPLEMGSAEVNAFLTHLAVEDQVSSSTQNQALSALLSLYRECWSGIWIWRGWWVHASLDACRWC
jgi:site-specific recombinase XerD